MKLKNQPCTYLVGVFERGLPIWTEIISKGKINFSNEIFFENLSNTVTMSDTGNKRELLKGKVFVGITFVLWWSHFIVGLAG